MAEVAVQGRVVDVPGERDLPVLGLEAPPLPQIQAQRAHVQVRGIACISWRKGSCSRSTLSSGGVETMTLAIGGEQFFPSR